MPCRKKKKQLETNFVINYIKFLNALSFTALIYVTKIHLNLSQYQLFFHIRLYPIFLNYDKQI
jgi:hypothetical protein